MPEGENEAFKKSGMGGKEEDRILLLQGQDFWGMEKAEEVVHKVSHKSTHQTCKDSGVLLGFTL